MNLTNLIMRAMVAAAAFIPTTVQASMPESGYEVAKEGAWCWFADPRAIHYADKDSGIDRSFIGYIDIHGNIKAMQYDFNKGTQEEVLIRSYFQPDDHDNPTFLVLPDKRIMVFYSRHTDEPCFYYRVSERPADITMLGEEKIIKTENNTTYPSPFILSDDPNHIYLCWRGIHWHPTIAQLSLPDANGDLTVEDGPYQIVQSTGARPYAKYSHDGKNRIFLTYTTGHPDVENPNYLYYNYIDINDMSLRDVKGKKLSDVRENVFKVNKEKEYAKKYPLTVVDNPEERDWVWQLAADKKGNPVIAMVRISPDKSSHDYYYARWDGKKWEKKFLANADGRFHQTPRLELCYSAGMAIDPANPNEIYCSLPVEGRHGRKYEIVKYVLNDNLDIVSTEAITKDSKLNNVRPYIVNDSEGTPLRLAWMHGNYYDWIVSNSHPLGYNTAIHADFEGFKPKYSLDKDFTYCEEIELDPENYQGCIADLGCLTYTLDGKTLIPEIHIGDKTYKSTNRLATADVWKSENRGTNGKWYAPTKHSKILLKIENHDGELTTYINGLIDQHIALK